MLIVGLGNPGAKYDRTRHNIGFRLLDELAALESGATWRGKYKGQLTDIRLGNRRVSLLKPQTFMNASGEAVLAAMSGLRLQPEQILVAHDELDLPFTRLKLKCGGGHGGNNGIRSIIASIGAKPFARLRMGIGHPGTGADVTRYVLGRFDSAEEANLPEMLTTAADAAQRWLNDGLEAATMWLHSDG